jgi:hypothetical protein
MSVRWFLLAAVVLSLTGVANVAHAQNGPWNNWGWGWGYHSAQNGPWNNWGWGWDRDHRDYDRDRDHRDWDRDRH